ncbi:fimbrial protein [Escherichia coli]
MNKSNIVLTLVATVGIISTAHSASTGTITFNGELTANTCDAVVDNQNADAIVTLPTVGINQLENQGQTAGRTGFNIALSNCASALTAASAFFAAGPSVDFASGHLKNTDESDGGAKLVSLQLRDEAPGAGSKIIQAGNGNQATGTQYVDVISGTANLPYSVEYFADGTATAGNVTSNVVYFIQYK